MRLARGGIRLLLGLALLILCACLARAETDVQTLFLNTREKATLPEDGGSLLYAFTPSENGDYVFRAFPESSDAAKLRVTLFENGNEVAHTAFGESPQIFFSLDADVSYLFRVEGAGVTVSTEVMREAHGRCFDMPISLESETTRYTKTVTKPRDTHWFRFTASVDGLYTLRTETASDEPLDTQAYLLDDTGATIAYNDDAAFPSEANFCIRADLKAGETYYLRLNAFSNTTGVYRLLLFVPGEASAVPTNLTVEPTSLTLEVGGSARLRTALSPEDAYPDVAFDSSDASVARVSPEGAITALRPGTATVTARALGGRTATCEVTVSPIRAQGVAFEEEAITLSVGASVSPKLLFTPSDASDQSASFASSNPRAAEVDASGAITGLMEGEAVITARSADGGFEASVTVRVTPRAGAFRALVMGEQLYVDGRTRVGAINSAQGVADMLESQSYAGEHQVTLRIDSTRESFFAALSSCFADAQTGDISLFYINCHGDTKNGIAYLELHDGTRVTARQLAAAFAEVKGSVVLLLDCCRSGGFLGSDEGERFGEEFVTDFRGSAFATGRFHVMTSAGSDEDSYRLLDQAPATEASTSTVFARALCEGAGWDLMRDKTVRARADANRDDVLSFNEWYLYVKKRVRYHLEDVGVRQSVQAYPRGSTLTLFTR